MRDTPVIVFGAGATKNCGGPLTNEILPEAFRVGPSLPEKDQAIALLREFLDSCFALNVPKGEPRDFPSLPLLLSLPDSAIDRKQPFGPAWPLDRVSEVRQAVEAAVFAVLDFSSPQAEATSYAGLLELAYPKATPEAAVISLNYDMILDMAMFDLCQNRKPDSVPSYGCDIKTNGYQSKEHWGSLLKIHGSVNWMYCSQCHHLEIGWSSKRSAPSRIGHLFFLSLDEQYAHRAHCPECQTRLRPVLITPTYCRQYLEGNDARQLGVAGAEDDTGPAAADGFEDFVMIQPAQRARLRRRGEEGEIRGAGLHAAHGRHALGFRDRALQEVANLRVRRQQGLNTAAQRLVAGTGFVQVGGSLLRSAFLQGGKEMLFRR
jgi:hypothetical protein